MTEKQTLTFLVQTKRDLKQSKWRQQYDAILDEFNRLAVNTVPRKMTIDQTQNMQVLLTVPKGNGQNDFVTLPRVYNSKGSDSDAPRSEIPIAYSKILTAASLIAGNIPDGTVHSLNKIKARLHYELWKRTWEEIEMNGMNSLDFAAQQLLATGTGAWRVYPRQVTVDKTINNKGKKVKTKKIIYDDLYREPMDMNRVWFGKTYKPTSDDGRPEVLWEVDITNENLKKLKLRFDYKPSVSENETDKKDTGNDGLSDEGMQEDVRKGDSFSTLTFYENPKENRYILATNKEVLYDGEMPNEELWGSVVVGHCFHKNNVSQYGTGLWELMRGNQAIRNYVESLTVEQVAAEIYPLIVGAGTLQGNMTLKRSPNYLNVIPAGMKLDKITTTGNSTLGMNMIDRLEQENNRITGINDVVAGEAGDAALGQTVILREAALSRLVKPRNSLARMIEKDFCICTSWFEQDQVNERQFEFGNIADVDAFQKANMMHAVRIQENNTPLGEFPNKKKKSFTVFATPKVPLSFDYNQEDLEESGYEQQDMLEKGRRSNMVPRAAALSKMKDLDGEIGYDKTVLTVDMTSMLIPSIEIQKQVNMQVFPIIQNSLMQIYGLARKDPDQAVSQLIAFETFLEIQRLNIYDYISKDDYDKIMAKGFAPSPQSQQQQQPNPQEDDEENEPMGSDNTPVGTPQALNEMPKPQSPMAQAIYGGMTAIPKKMSNTALGKNKKK